MSHDLTIDEKRVYADRTGATEVLVAAEQGLVVASLSADLVGEFGLDHRATVRDVAATGDRRVVATDEDVLVGSYDPTDFGPAVAVGFDGEGAPVAAAPDGRVARLDGDWTRLGAVDDPRAVDAGMIAAADGVHQVVDDGLRSVGLADARDVHGRGMPFAATAAGLYRLGNGWMAERDGAATAVSADGDRAVAVDDDGLLVREGVASWTGVETPATERVVDVGFTEAATVAVTAAGTLLTDAGDGWRTRALGVTGVSRLAVQA
ncbi:HVO_0234 family beta-propeller protein [Haloplanus ruber]|nr:hypothetical protein [Haloplanus ruber]